MWNLIIERNGTLGICAMNGPHTSPKICIVGKNKLQYDLLSFCLKKELKAQCVRYAELPLTESVYSDAEKHTIWLFDFRICGLDTLEKHFADCLPEQSNNIMIALFNVPPTYCLKKLVEKYKIRGFFYKEDSGDVLLKGLRNILDGHLWLSRKTMSNCILKYNKYRDQFVSNVVKCDILSDREKVILQNVASGARNQDIADNLAISVHTVKSHLYKIYRKIDVPNRLQASIWANQKLQVD